VSASLRKRIRCLSTCPAGTRGRIVCRRLAHTQHTAFTPTLHLQPPLTAEAVHSLSRAATNALRRLQDVFDQDVKFQTNGQERPKTGSKGPLDSALTGLRPIPTPNPQSPIGSLLYAIDQHKVSAILHSLKNADRHLLLRHLQHHQFSALLRSIQPDAFLGLKERHRLDANGNVYVVSEKKAFEEFKANLTFIVNIMRKLGYRLTVRDYQHLIDCAHTGGDANMAVGFWNSMAGAGDVQLDTWVYNSFMAAISGSATYEREVRVRDAILQHRAQRKPEYLRERAYKLFSRMIEKRIAPNSMSFDILMLAMARMGDIAGIESILKRVWGVDVHGLPDEVAVNDKRIAMREDSPLYPTGHTLVAIATAYCQNGQLDVAVRVVDHISRRYDIPLSAPVWVALMNWSYVFSRQRKEIPVDVAAVQRVWNVMTAEPYNVSPTADMYDYIIRSYLWRRMPGAAEAIMDSAAIQLFQRTVWRAAEIEQRIVHGKVVRGSPQSWEKPKGLILTIDDTERLKQDLFNVLREDHRIRSMMKRWTELLTIGKDMEMTSFGTQEVPRIIEKWRCFLGKTIVYVLRTGHLRLYLGKEGLQKPIVTRKRRWYQILLGTGAKEEDDFF
jgi:hypothetical protein